MKMILRRMTAGALIGAMGGLTIWYILWADGDLAPVLWKYITIPAAALAFLCGPLAWGIAKVDLHTSV